MKAVAIYARVSTAQQEKQGTIESQLAVLEEYATEHELALSPEHRYIDEGYSGASLDRPGLEGLRDAAWRGELDAVLILCPDRLARHYAYQYVVVEELQKCGCEILFASGSLGNTPEERLVREVQGLFAEFERAAIVERGRRGKLHAAREGQFFTGAAPYGYTYIKKRDGQSGYCKVNEAEAATVRQMFAWLVEEQLSTYAIAKRLTELGVPTRRGEVPWSPASVHKILNNRAYTGVHYYNRTMNAPEVVGGGTVLRPSSKEPRRVLRPSSEWIAVPWTPIITEEVFELAARQLQLNRERSPRRSSRYQYLLAGLLYCGYCGRRLCGHAGVASGRYECTRRRAAEPPESRCHLRSVSQRDIEPLVWEHVARLLGQPEVIMGYLREQREGEGPETTDGGRELKRLRNRKAALEREEQRLIDAYQAAAIELDELKDRRGRLREAGKHLDQREEALKTQLAQAEQAATLQEAVTEFCERIGGQLVDPSFELKQQILRLVVEGVFVTDEEILIRHIIPCEDTSRLYLRLGGDPENRLVARHLERAWEEKLEERRRLKEECDRSARSQPRTLSEEEIRAIRRLSKDIPALWEAPATAAADRKEIVRQVVEGVVVDAEGMTELVEARIEWVGGGATEANLIRPVARYEQLSYWPRLRERVSGLAGEGLTAEEIAERLNEEGYRPPRCGATFRAAAVRKLRGRLGMGGKPPAHKPLEELGPHEWWLADLARAVGTPKATLYSWIKRGWVGCRKSGRGRWIVRADPAETERLRELHHRPEGYYARQKWIPGNQSPASPASEEEEHAGER